MDKTQIRRIPPMTAQETLAFYVSGRMPERFRKTDQALIEEIIDQYTNQHIRTEENHL